MRPHCLYLSCRFSPPRFSPGSLPRILAAAALVLLALMGAPRLARSEDLVNVNGRIYSDDGKSPLADADVAVIDDKNKVVAQGKTDAEGKYALAVPRKYLHLPGGRKSNGFGSFFGALVGEAIGVINPFAGLGYEVAQGLAGAARHSGASQADVARLYAGRVTQEDGDRLIAAGARKQDVERMLKYSAENFDADGNYIPRRNSAGALTLKATLAGRKEVNGVGQIYWMQTDKVRSENGREKRETNAWFDPIVLVEENAEKPSRFARSYFTLTDALMDPAVVETGQTVTLSVMLPVPPEQSGAPLIVIARNSKTGKMYELTPTGDGGVYRCRIEIDKKFPKKDQLFGILAYPRAPDKPGRDARAEKTLETGGVWKLDRPYVYNPLLLASRNRADVLLTVEKPAR